MHYMALRRARTVSMAELEEVIHLDREENTLSPLLVSSSSDSELDVPKIIVVSSDEELSLPYKKKTCLSNEECVTFPFTARTTPTLPQRVKSEPEHYTATSSSSERCFFEDNQNIPLHSLSGKVILAEEVVTLLFEAKDAVIATEQPLHCMQTASFIVNCDKLAHHSDIRMDDLGCWVNTGVDRLYMNVHFASENKVSLVKKLPSRPAVLRKSIYRLTRSYWKHKQNSSFCRQLHQINDWNGKEYPLVYLRYIVKGDDGSVDITPVPHGNTKHDGTPYYRTKESVKRKIVETSKSVQGREVFNKLRKEAGGVHSCQSLGDAPRNPKQITNARYKLSNPQANKDSLFEVMKECMQGQSRSDPFIRNVQAARDGRYQNF